MLKRFAGISLQADLPAINMSQKASGDVASPGKRIDMPITAMGSVAGGEAESEAKIPASSG